MQRIAVAAVLWMFPASLSAQWLNFKTPGIPRTADGKPDLTCRLTKLLTIRATILVKMCRDSWQDPTVRVSEDSRGGQ
jgi:hypothetical protein